MLSVRTLGEVSATLGTVSITPSAFRMYALVLRLSADAGRSLPRSVLQELIFADQDEKAARHSLRQFLYTLRQQGADLESTPSAVRLRAESVWIDSEALMREERPSADLLNAARGGLLPGYAPTLSEAFSEWLEGYRANTSFGLAKSMVRAISRARAAGDRNLMEQAARACLALDPLNEEGTLALAEMLAMSGAKAQAIKLLDYYIDEVGISSRDLRIPAAVLRRRISEQDWSKFRSPVASPFVGREPHIATLSKALKRVRASECQCVIITGEPGIGKSRLVSEFCMTASIDGASVLVVAAQPNDLYRPFGVFADMLPALLAMRGSLGCAPETLRLLDRLRKSPGDELSLNAEALRDSDALCHSITNAIVDLVDAVSSERPLVLAMEDAHWLDQMSLRVLVCLASKRKPRQLFAILTTRQLRSIEAFVRYADNADFVELAQLAGTALSQITAFLGATNDVAVDKEMSRWLEETSSGNPLFLETLFEHFATTGQRFVISPSLSTLISRRLDSLSHEACATLQICALLGKHSTLETLIDAVQLRRFELVRALTELETARLVRTEGQSIQPAHQLISDFATRGLPLAAKRLAHHGVATALESLLDKRPSPALVWDCAEHWVAAHDAAKALNAVKRCAARALEMGRPAEAAEALNWATSLDLARDEQQLLGRQLVLAADAASEHALVFRGLEMLRRDGVLQEHDDLEFAEFRACARAWFDAPAQESKLIQCIKSVEASANHRVAAATWLLKHADIHNNIELASSAVSALDEGVIDRADEAVRLEYALIRDCGLGEWDRAATTARKLQAAARTTSPQISLSLQLNASLAFERCGLTDEAIDAATALFLEAESRGMHRIRARAAAFVAEQFFDKGDDASASIWFDRIANPGDHLSNLSVDFAPAVARLSYLLTIGNTSQARELFDRVERGGSFSGGSVRARWHRALTERLRQLENPNAAAEIFEPEFHEATRAEGLIGIADFEVATACHSLIQANKNGIANELFYRYAIARRQARTRLSRCLRDLERTFTPIASDGGTSRRIT